MCEIRFSLSNKDGKLEQMMKSVNAGVRTEVVKEALRYYLSHVRDEKVESMYIDSNDLAEFKSGAKPNMFSVDDVMKIIECRAVQPSVMMPQQIQQHSVHQVNIQSETLEKEEEYINEPVIEFDCDNSEVLANEDMLDDVDF